MRNTLSLSVGLAILALGLTPAPSQGQATGPLVANINANCAVLIYEDDCISAVRRAFNESRTAPDADRTRVTQAIAEVATKHPELAPRIKEITDAR